MAAKLYLAAETSLSAVAGHVDEVMPRLLIVDSVQTMSVPEAPGAPGGVTQVREVAAGLIRLAKERNIATVLVGHVTKDGSIAGPRVLEHLVDVVLQFEGDRHSQLRILRAVKNRYGPTDEIGCFELTDSGIVGLPDPSGLFLTRRAEPVPGTCVTVTVEGRRPLIAEVQALVAPTALPQPRRATSGLDAAGSQWCWRCWRSGSICAWAQPTCIPPRLAGCAWWSRRWIWRWRWRWQDRIPIWRCRRHGRYR